METMSVFSQIIGFDHTALAVRLAAEICSFRAVASQAYLMMPFSDDVKIFV